MKHTLQWTPPQVLTCAVGQAIGDVIAQAATSQGFAAVGFNLHRSVVLCSFAALVGGPTGHYWNRALESRVCRPQPTSNRAVFGKLALDQAS